MWALTARNEALAEPLRAFALQKDADGAAGRPLRGGHWRLLRQLYPLAPCVLRNAPMKRNFA
jgi:hypothetical protein